MTDHSRRTPPSDFLLAETVRIIEERQPLPDDAAIQRAFERHRDREGQLLERAKVLAASLHLPTEVQHWKSLVRYTGLALAVMAIILGTGIAASVTGQDNTINAPYALLLALGPHLFALLLWLLTFWRSDLAEESSLGSIMLRAAARLPIRRGPYFWDVLDAALSLYARYRLLPWVAGIASHAFWSVGLLAVLITLGISFSFHSYRLTWETTILPADFFVGFVQISGWLPHQLGFPLPDSATLLTPDSPYSDHRAWAWWLIGCIAIYGLLPRLVLLLISWAVWRSRVKHMKLDLSLPYFAKLLARLNTMEPSAVVDREKKTLQTVRPLTRSPVPGEAVTLAVVGFELPEEMSWPPKNMPRNAVMMERIAGSNQERRAILDKLTTQRPYLLLFACNKQSSPDRGTAHFIREAATHAVRCALLLLPLDDDALSAKRWTTWLADMNMQAVPCFTHTDEVALWMEDSND